MDKKVITLIITIALILGILLYKSNSNTFKINKDKIKEITYVYEIEKNKMGRFDVTSGLSQEDINSIVDSLNNGVLRPDKKEVGKYTLEHIEILVLGDRLFSIYKQEEDRFTVMYSINPGSNNIEDEKQTTIESEVLKSYFDKFKEVSKSLDPSITWNINKD